MHVESVTTPHGRRSVDLAHLRRQVSNANDIPRSSLTANKWQVFRDICTARLRFGLKDRALAVLNALLSFYPEVELSRKAIVVFPSNTQLSARANGIAGATLRRALAALVDAGLIERHDSPNGKRYARRDGAGEIARAFGFALTPLLVRSAEIASLAAKVAEEARQLRQNREALSIARRDARKLISVGKELATEYVWRDMADEYQAIITALPRNPSPAETQIALTQMSALRERAIKALDLKDKTSELSVNDARIERHLEDSFTENQLEEKKLFSDLKKEDQPTQPAPKLTPPTHPPLDMVTKACPQIIEYANGQDVRSWRDLQLASCLASSMLGISKPAWLEACDVMGIENASASVAHILERHEQIKSPGGYLRHLTEKTRSGAYNPTEVIMSLMVTRPSSHSSRQRRY